MESQKSKNEPRRIETRERRMEDAETKDKRTNSHRNETRNELAFSFYFIFHRFQRDFTTSQGCNRFSREMLG